MSRGFRWAAWLLLAAVLLFNGFMALRADGTFVRTESLIGVSLLVALTAYRLGHHHATMRFVESMAEAVRWTPSDITWHVDDDGTRHALVTTQGGELRSIPIPNTVENPEQALAYIIDALREPEGEQ